MKEMYKGMVNSPVTELKESISAQATVIKVNNINTFPQGPNLAVIGTDENAETIYYATKTTNALSGCQRGVEGSAKTWNAGEKIARNFTNKDHADLIDNVKELNESKASMQEVAGLRQTVNQKASELQELSRKVGVLEQGGGGSSEIEVAEARYSNNTFVISNFQVAENVAFLMRVVSVQQDSLAIDEHTQVQIENTYMPFKNFNGEPFFEQVATNGEVQRVFVCIRKGNEVWADALPTKILKKINDIEGKVLEATEQANRAFQSANNAKEMLVEAIVGMGGSGASTSESFSELIMKCMERLDYAIITQPKFPTLHIGNYYDNERKYLIFERILKIKGERHLLLFRIPSEFENRLKSSKKMTMELELGRTPEKVRVYLTYANGDSIKEMGEINRGEFEEENHGNYISYYGEKEINNPFFGPLVESATDIRIALEIVDNTLLKHAFDSIMHMETILHTHYIVRLFRIWFS